MIGLGQFLIWFSAASGACGVLVAGYLVMPLMTTEETNTIAETVRVGRHRR